MEPCHLLYRYRLSPHVRSLSLSHVLTSFRPSECLPDLAKAGFIGDELGQLKCDLTDSTDVETFARIVRGIWSATKGPYSLLYVKPGDPQLWEKVICRS